MHQSKILALTAVDMLASPVMIGEDVAITLLHRWLLDLGWESLAGKEARLEEIMSGIKKE